MAGHDTTSNSLTLGTRVLARHPEVWSYWRSHPEKSVDSTIELMRFMAMSTTLPRIASADFEWRGRQIRKNDLVMLMIAGGNRDPRVFSDPDRLDLTRGNDLSLTFGPGLHHCIGHLLAKLQLSEFFNALVHRFDGVQILEEPVFQPVLVFRTVQALRVKLLRRIEQAS
jgi:cytochrome P450